ncbi:hypothetical protein NHF45_12895 [Maricaulaceae bacterium NA33B04]|nr:hypothetical protein [Maricaulaceae bacterium NA33B04]
MSRISAFAASVLGAVVLAGFAATPVEAACRWQVTAEIQRTDANGAGPNGREPGVDLIVRSRASALSPFGPLPEQFWIGTVEPDGGVVITSPVLPDPICQTPHQLTLEAVAPLAGLTDWTELVAPRVIPPPTALSGPTLAVTFTHAVEGGVFFITGLDPIDDASDDDDGPTLTAQPAPPVTAPATGSVITAAPNEDPCASYRLVSMNQPDFDLVTHPMAGGQGLTPDELMRLARRQVSGVISARAVNATFRIINNGGRDWIAPTGSGGCIAGAQLQVNEGPNAFGGWTAHEVKLDTVRAGPIGRLVTLQAALRGSGADTPTEWDEDYEYALVRLDLDFSNAVWEANEANSFGPWCYHAPSGAFVDLNVCWTDGGGGDTGGQDDVADPPAAGGADDPGEDADPEPSGLPNRDMEAQFDPCARLRLLQPGDVEFRFAQLGEILGAASPDSHIDLTLRPIANPYLRRFNIAFGVENAGSVNFSASRQCPVIVRMRSFEGADGQSGGRTGWSPPREVEIGDIAVNAVDSLSFEGSFFGTGNQPIGGWNQNWEYTLVELTVDVPNRVSELAEGDNRIVHCYHAPGQSFVPLSLCGGDQPDEQE